MEHLRNQRSKHECAEVKKLAILAASLATFLSVDTVRGDTVISMDAHRGGTTVYLPAGNVVVKFTPFIVQEPHSDDGLAPPGVSGYIQVVARRQSGEEIVLANYRTFGEPENPVAQTLWLTTEGTASFENPEGQEYTFFERGGIIVGHGGVRATTGGYFAWDPQSGPTTVTGAPPPPPNPTPKSSGSPQSSSPPPVRHNIHALIVSGRSDPGLAITSPNTTLVGGIVALGTTSRSPVTWQPGLRVIPDDGLLQGKNVPPIVPGLIDVRITDFQTSADFRSLKSTP